MDITRVLRGTLIAAFGLLVGAAGARADTINVVNLSVTPSEGGFTWGYSATVTAPSSVEAGDFFTIFDFAGFTGVTSQDPDWSFSSSLLGVYPDPALVIIPPGADDPTIPNLTWTYMGATIDGPFTFPPFFAESVFSTPGPDFFVAQDHFTPTVTNTVTDQQGNIGVVMVPVAPVAVPEPGTLFLIGAGLLGVARAARRRNIP